MNSQIIFVSTILIILMGHEVRTGPSDADVIEKIPLQSQTAKPLTTILLNGKGIGNVNSSDPPTTETLARVKRQYGYSYGRRYPYPVIIFGGYGGRAFGGRGFGGRGFGGRGFGGGFGGRGGGVGGGIGGGHGGGGGRG